MKLDPLDNFLTKWPTRSPNYQLLSLLCVLVAKNGGSTELDPQDILDVQPGEAVVLSMEAGKVVLRSSPVQTLVYAVQDTGTPWRNENQQATSSTASIMSDEQIAQREEQLKRAAELQRQAREMREVEPLTGAIGLGRVKTARTSREPQ